VLHKKGKIPCIFDGLDALCGAIDRGYKLLYTFFDDDP
jgi:hypothetical protein